MLDKLIDLGKNISKLITGSDIGSKPISDKMYSEISSCFDWHALSSFLPYQAYDPDEKIFINRSGAGFVIEMLPLLGSNDALQREITTIFQELMDEESSVQFLLFADYRIDGFLGGWENARTGFGNIYSELAKRRRKYLNGMMASDLGHPGRLFRCIVSYSIECGSIDSTVITSLKSKRERLLKMLGNYTQAFTWDVTSLLRTLDGIINFKFDSQPSSRIHNPYETLASQLPSGGGMAIEENNLIWKNSDEAAFRTYRVTDFPNGWSLHLMQNLIGDLFREAFNVKFPFFLHYGVHCPKQIKIEGEIKRQMHFVEQQGRSSLLLRMIPDLRKELEEFDMVRERLNDMDRLVWTQLGVGIWAPEKNFERQDQAVKSMFRTHGFTLSDNRYVHLPHFLSFLPMGWGEYVKDLKNLNVLKTTCATECGNLVPLQGEWWGTPTMGMLLTGRRGQIFCWHPFDNKTGNYNAVVVGKSGSGKSVFMQELLMSGLGLGANVFVLDVGRSFERMCSIVEGQFIEFSEKTTLCINPFSTISADDKDERETSFTMLKAILATMAAPQAGTTDYENALLEQAIKAVWKKKKNEATISSVSEWLISHEDKIAVTLGTMLMPYTAEGVHGKFFEGRNNINFEKSMVLVELEALKEKKDLQLVVLQTFIMAITNRIFLGDRKTPFHICIDEAWDLLRGKQSGVFIETLARRLRKYNGSLVVGTQSIDDFYVTPGALAAFENSDWMCLLSQKKSSITRFRQSGRIDLDAEKEKILESIHSKQGEFSEAMICDSEGFYAVGRLLLDGFSLLLYSTKADEYSQLKALQKEGLSVTEAVERLMKQKKQA